MGPGRGEGGGGELVRKRCLHCKSLIFYPDLGHRLISFNMLKYGVTFLKSSIIIRKDRFNSENV